MDDRKMPMRRNMGMPKVKIPKGTFKRLMKYIFSHYKFQLLIVMLCLLVSGCAGAVASSITQTIVDDIIIPGMNAGFSSVKNELYEVIGKMIFIYSLGVVCSLVYTQIMAGVTQGLLHHFRKDMFDKMQSLPISYFDTHQHGEIMSTYTNDTDTLRQLVGQSLPNIFLSVTSIVVIFAMMISFSLWLTLIVALCVIVMLNVTKKVGGASSKYMIEQQKSLAKEEGFIEEMIKGQKVIKVFCHEEESKKDFDKLNEKLYEDSQKANKFGNILMPILGNIGNIMFVLIAFIGAFLAIYEIKNVSLRGLAILTPGIIISFLSLSRQFSHTIGQVSHQVAMIAMGLAGAGRIFSLLDEKEETDNGYVVLVNCKKKADGSIEECEEKTGVWAWKHYHKDSDTTTFKELKGEIILDQVDFGYIENKLVLRDISIHAKPGEKVALVGATGAGKTTITNLINRFYDIQDGKIRYDGININKIKKKDLRRSFGMVLQDTNLFTGTVMDNIRYGKLSATDEECIEAAKQANADSFITRLPDGYNTLLTNNGANLSQGQRQLLSIARAIVADAPAMILDEATSSIDTRSEKLVQDAMDKLMKGRTVFVIAHRLSTIHNSDIILVMDKGRIIERGNHEELMKLKGTYYKLYTGKFELD
jgi:ATP-binding cassette subfamily B protein